MMQLRKALIANLLAVASFGVFGAGLGDLKIKSSLGEHLNAEIDLISVTRDEVSSLDVRLAGVDAYTQRNLRYDPALLDSRIAVLRRSDGRHYLSITTRRPINEPYIDLLIEMSWGEGQMLRAYSSFIDPSGYVPGVQVARLPNSPPIIAVGPSAVAPAPKPIESSPRLINENAGVAPIAVQPTSDLREHVADASPAFERPSPAEAIRPTVVDSDSSGNSLGQTAEQIAAAELVAESKVFELMGIESDEARAARLEEIASALAAANMDMNRTVDAAAKSPRLVQAPRNASSVQTNQPNRMASGNPTARQSPKPPRNDVLKLTATGVLNDPVRAAEENALAEQIRLLEERVRVKQIALRDIDEKIERFKARNIAAGARSDEEQNIARKGPLRDIDQNAAEMIPVAGKYQSTEGDIQTVAGGHGEALSKGPMSSATKERSQKVVVASKPAVRIAPPKGARLPATLPQEESILENPLVLGGGALVLALVAGLGTWQFRRRRAMA